MKYLQAIFLFLVFSAEAWSQLENYTVVYFLSETCPICQNQSKSINQLHSTYQKLGLKTIAYFPNISLTNTSSISEFKKKYQLGFPVYLDINQFFTKKFQAKVTPQVFLVNNETNEILYKGKIDNSYERVGKRRQRITEFYLDNVLKSIINNEKITLNYTEPIGCIISLIK